MISEAFHISEDVSKKKKKKGSVFTSRRLECHIKMSGLFIREPRHPKCWHCLMTNLVMCVTFEQLSSDTASPENPHDGY